MDSLKYLLKAINTWLEIYKNTSEATAPFLNLDKDQDEGDAFIGGVEQRILGALKDQVASNEREWSNLTAKKLITTAPSHNNEPTSREQQVASLVHGSVKKTETNRKSTASTQDKNTVTIQPVQAA